MNKFIIATIAATVLAGCAPPPVKISRDEWLAAKNRNYTNITNDQALSAAENLFNLADDSFYFSHSDDGMTAKIDTSIFTFFGIEKGSDTWKVTTKNTDNGLKITIDATRDAPLAGQSFIGQPSLYKLFWLRMDYLLGKSDNWVTCDQAVSVYGMVKNGITNPDSIDLLCATASNQDLKP